MSGGAKLGIDYGQARIGVAVSGSGTSFALPLKTIIRGRYGEELDEICDLIEHRQIGEVIVGSPIHMCGKLSAMAREARNFAKQIASDNPHVRVALLDERLTSKQAEASLRDLSITTREAKQRIDAVAAAIILEQALTIERATGRPAGTTVHAQATT